MESCHRSFVASASSRGDIKTAYTNSVPLVPLLYTGPCKHRAAMAETYHRNVGHQRVRTNGDEQHQDVPESDQCQNGRLSSIGFDYQWVVLAPRPVSPGESGIVRRAAPRVPHTCHQPTRAGSTRSSTADGSSGAQVIFLLTGSDLCQLRSKHKSPGQSWSIRFL